MKTDKRNREKKMTLTVFEKISVKFNTEMAKREMGETHIEAIILGA